LALSARRRSLAGLVLGALAVVGVSGGIVGAAPDRVVALGGHVVTSALRPAGNAVKADPRRPLPAQGLGYVQREGSVLTLHGTPVLFVGVDAYEASNAPDDPRCGPVPTDDQLDELFASLPAHALVRSWAFQAMVPVIAGGVRDWSGLDRLVATAARYGDKLDLSLADNWGTCDDGHQRNLSWYLGGYHQAFDDNGRHRDPLPYWDWVQTVVSRYAGDSAVAMWEPVNEPEADTCAGRADAVSCDGALDCSEPRASAGALRSFFDDVGGLIHRLAPHQLVEEGTAGTDNCGVSGSYYAMVGASPGVDVLSVHDDMQLPEPLPLGASPSGQRARLAQAATLDKPLMLGELGEDAASLPGCRTLSSRQANLSAEIRVGLFAGFAAIVVWNWVPVHADLCNLDVAPGDPLLAEYPSFAASAAALARLTVPPPP
jgi:mannan endo-1,4-beta-mannosidase